MQTVRWKARGVLRRSAPLRRAVVARRHRGLTETDLMIASFPRSGNTWVRFVLADLIKGEPADFIGLEHVIPGVGAQRGAPRTPSGLRLVKTHEPYRPDYRQAIYLIRDFREVLISWYRITRPDPDDLSDLDDFVANFVTHRASPYGPWHSHVQSWLRAAEANPGIEIVRFEELRADPVGGFTRLADRVGLGTERQTLEAAIARNSIGNVQARARANREFLAHSFGNVSAAGRGRGAGRSSALSLNEGRVRALRPALELNERLGYPIDDNEPDSASDPAGRSPREQESG